MAKPSSNSTIDYIIGLPPGNLSDDVVAGRSQIVMENSMPIAKIYPGIPSFTEGLSLFTRSPAFKSEGKKNLSYLNILNNHGYGLKQPKYSNTGEDGCLVLAYLADSFPTDSFSNEYGENFLQGLTNVASEGAAAITQMMGARDLGQAATSLTNRLKNKGGTVGSLGRLLESGKNIASETLGALLPPSVTGGVDLISRLAAGSRIDFPMIWKSSSFQSSYTMTVRLYNPNPANKASTIKYIAAPIAAIMLLAIPISSDGVTYSWPFIHKIVSPGIYNLDSAFISNVTIIKGGDQQQISFKQSLGVVDVRIDFGSLYSSMLAAKGLSRTRPTLKSYLNAMVGIDSEKSGVRNFSSTSPTSVLQQEKDEESLKRNTDVIQSKNQAQTTSELTDEEKDNPPDRVSASTKTTANRLVSNLPSFFNV